MKIKNLMTSKVVTLNSNTPYKEAARILYDNHISGAPVLNDDGEIVGMLSEKDLYRVLFPFYKSFYEHPESYTDFENRENKVDEIKNNPINKYMTTTEIYCTNPEDLAMKVGAIMLARGIHRAPVLENGKLVGLVSRRDIFRNVLKSHLGF